MRAPKKGVEPARKAARTAGGKPAGAAARKPAGKTARKPTGSAVRKPVKKSLVKVAGKAARSAATRPRPKASTKPAARQASGQAARKVSGRAGPRGSAPTKGAGQPRRVQPTGAPVAEKPRPAGLGMRGAGERPEPAKAPTATSRPKAGPAQDKPVAVVVPGLEAGDRENGAVGGGHPGAVSGTPVSPPRDDGGAVPPLPIPIASFTI